MIQGLFWTWCCSALLHGLYSRELYQSLSWSVPCPLCNLDFQVQGAIHHKQFSEIRQKWGITSSMKDQKWNRIDAVSLLPCLGCHAEKCTSWQLKINKVLITCGNAWLSVNGKFFGKIQQYCKIIASFWKTERYLWLYQDYGLSVDAVGFTVTPWPCLSVIGIFEICIGQFWTSTSPARFQSTHGHFPSLLTNIKLWIFLYIRITIIVSKVFWIFFAVNASFLERFPENYVQVQVY